MFVNVCGNSVLSYWRYWSPFRRVPLKEDTGLLPSSIDCKTFTRRSVTSGSCQGCFLCAQLAVHLTWICQSHCRHMVHQLGCNLHTTWKHSFQLWLVTTWQDKRQSKIIFGLWSPGTWPALLIQLWQGVCQLCCG